MKISDFGVSVLLPENNNNNNNNAFNKSLSSSSIGDLDLFKTAGSPAFFAPELCAVEDTFNLNTPSLPKLSLSNRHSTNHYSLGSNNNNNNNTHHNPIGGGGNHFYKESESGLRSSIPTPSALKMDSVVLSRSSSSSTSNTITTPTTNNTSTTTFPVTISTPNIGEMNVITNDTMMINGDDHERMNPTTTTTAVSLQTFGEMIDVWALGVTLYCLIFGRVPFIADTEYELFNVITKSP